MPQPTAKDVHIDSALTNFAMRYSNARMIAGRVFSILPVGKQSGKYFTYAKGAWFRDEAAVRAPGTRSRGGGFRVSTDTYACDEWAWHDVVPDEVRDNADAPLQPDLDATRFCINKILLRLERLVASLVLTAANWASGHSEDAEGGWAAGAGNTFIADVEGAIETVRLATGLRPNKLIMDGKTFKEIKQESTVLDRIKYTERGIVTPDLLASMFDLDQVLIGDAIYSTAEETAAGDDFTGAQIWETNAGKGSAVLLYAPSSVGLREPTAGVLFRWTRQTLRELVPPPSEFAGLPVGVRKWRDEWSHSDVVEAFMDVDAKITGNDLGYLFYDTIAT